MAKTNKALQVRALVYRPQGVTHKELKAALGWPAVNVYDQARAGKFNVISIKPRGGGEIRYYGIPTGAKVKLIDTRAALELRWPGAIPGTIGR